MNYYIKYQGMSLEKAQKIRSGSALTSALGPTKDIRVSPYEIDSDVLKEVKYFILTSDGIHDYIGNHLFELVLTSKDTTLKEKANKLIKEAINGGSKDNLTVVILENDQ
jgi:protein phosphatase